MTFFDDELPPEPKRPRTKCQRWTRRIFIALLVFGAFIWISLQILMNFGGNNPSLRQGLEAYLRGATGLTTQIHRFDFLNFYPALKVSMGDITFSPPLPPGDKGLPQPSVAAIDSVKISMDFWDMMFGRGRVRLLDIRNIDFRNALNLPRPLLIDTLALQKGKAGGDGAKLIVRGYYGPDAFTADQAMNYVEVPGGKSYFVRPEKGPFSFHSPFLNIAGTLSKLSGGGLQLDVASLGLPDTMLSGEIFLRRAGKGTAIDAHLKGGHSDLVLKLTRTQGQITGTVHFLSFDPADTSIVRAAQRTYNLLMPVHEKTNLSLAVQIDALKINNQKIGQLNFPVKTQNGILATGPFTGTLNGQTINTPNKTPAINCLLADLSLMDAPPCTEFSNKAAQ